MCNLSLCTLIFVFISSCYVSGNTKTAASTDDDDFLQAINLPNSPNNNPKPYTPIQEQQKQQEQQQQQQTQTEEQQQHHKQHSQHPKKRSLLASEAAAATVIAGTTKRTRQKRSQHILTNSEEYLKNMPTSAYNLVLLNLMHSLRKQLSIIELARLRSRLGRSAAADLQLFNEIYNNNNNYKPPLFNDGLAAINGIELGNSNDNGIGTGTDDGAEYDIGFGTGATHLIDTDTGHGGREMLGGIGGDAVADNDRLANDIEDLAHSVPWRQYVERVSKKSSALYKPRLGKRTQLQPQQQQQQQQQQPISCN